MPCSYCHGRGHNRRTCRYFEAEKWASMIAQGFSKDVIYREIDCFCPGAGLACQVVDVAYHSVLYSSTYSRMSERDRFRKAVDIINEGAGFFKD